MTTKPEERQIYWSLKYPTMKNWKILDRGLTRKQAQDLETRVANNHGCESSHGGNDPDEPSKWCVYHFEY